MNWFLVKDLKKTIIKSKSFNVGHFSPKKKVSWNHHNFSNSCLAFWLLGIYKKDQLGNEIVQLNVKNDFLMKFDKAAIILMVMVLAISWPSLISRYQIKLYRKELTMILCPKIRFLKFISNYSFSVHQEAITKTHLPHVRKFAHLFNGLPTENGDSMSKNFNVRRTFPLRFFWLVFKQATKIITAIMTVATIAADAGMRM